MSQPTNDDLASQSIRAIGHCCLAMVLAMMLCGACRVAANPPLTVGEPAAAAATPSPTRGETALPAGPPVPAAALDKLKAQVIPPGSRLPYNTQVRRLQAALRSGEQLERDSPDASNIHLIRNTMLDITKQLAVVQNDEQSQRRVFELAQRIVSLPGPPEGKIWADFLLTHARVSADRSAAGSEIADFVSRYADSTVAHVALMFAVDMAGGAGEVDLHRSLVRKLLTYREEPIAEVFLRDHGANVFNGYSLNGSVTTIDGTTLHFPRDLLGKVTVLHFWSVSEPHIPFMRALYDRYHDQGLNIIGINVDRDRDEVEAFIRQQDIPWPQVCTGKGPDDPLFQRLGIFMTPFCWVIGWDGRIAVANTGSDTVGNQSMRTMVQAVNNIVSMSALPESLRHYRSGEFLALTPLLGPVAADAKDAIPPTDLNALRAKLLVPRWTGISLEQKIQSFKEVLLTGQSLEKNHPTASNLSLVRSWMLIAARWLAITTGDNSFVLDAVAIANRLLGSNPTLGSALLADYVMTDDQLAQMEPRTKGGGRLIQDFADRYAQTDIAWAAQSLAIMLTFEDAQDNLRKRLVEQLRAFYTRHPDPLFGDFISYCGGQQFESEYKSSSTRAPLASTDGRVPPANPLVPTVGTDSEAINAADSDRDFMRDPLEHIRYYRSGEFLATTPMLRPAAAEATDAIDREDLDALRTMLLVPRWTGISLEQKVQSFKEVLIAGQALEQSHPTASNLSLVRSWMLIAARWLAMATGDRSFDQQAQVLARSLLASSPGPGPSLLADYGVTADQLAGMEGPTEAGDRLIRDYAARYAQTDVGPAAQVLAIMLTFQGAHVDLRQSLLEKLRVLPVIYGFLRDGCGQRFYRGDQEPSFRTQLTRMDGRTLTLPDDLLGKVVIPPILVDRPSSQAMRSGWVIHK